MVVLILFLFGLVIGSFLNVLIDRAPLSESILWGRSHCDYCKKPLRWFELLPVVSYVVQKGMCRRCHKKLRVQYPIVELTNAVFYGAIAWSLGPITTLADIGMLLAILLFTSSSLAIVVADFLYQLIPDGSIVMLIVASLIRITVSPASAVTHIGSAVGAFGVLYFLWWVTRGKGMGFGDVKLAGALGLFFGFPDIVLSFYIAFLTGAIVGVILMLGKRAGMKTKIAFGPFLIFGAIVTLVFSQPIYTLWFSLI